MNDGKYEYKFKISPRMLELLSKDLYTNIYFVLSELIANAYDADAENVYIYFNDDVIRVEDDGVGMSPSDVSNIYLTVGYESRKSMFHANTSFKKRIRMGRKGVGKLAALSISDGFKLISIKDNIKTALFVPNRIENDNETLKYLPDSEYKLINIGTHGTAIIMEKPKIRVPKTQNTIVSNLSKIFPIRDDDFRIHIIYNGNDQIVTPKEDEIVDRLATLITIGDEYKGKFKINNSEFLHSNFPEEIKKIEIKNNNGIIVNKELKIKGWIGSYTSTKNLKKDINEFSENYIAIFANGKMGMRNVLPIVSKNKMYENFLIGNLYIDIFEDSDLPDMASTDRQSYNENDIRWIEATKIIRAYMDKIINLHIKYAKNKKIIDDEKKLAAALENENKLKLKINEFGEKLISRISKQINNSNNTDNILDIKNELEELKPIIGFKSHVDSDKKKILISQTKDDLKVSMVLYDLLTYNNIPKSDIIFSNGPDPETMLPEKDIYEYLRKFFINSVSDEKIFVLFVASPNVYPNSNAWAVLMEMGATWVTRKDHWLFCINGFEPKQPLNVQDKWVNISFDKDDDSISLTEPDLNSLCEKIIYTTQQCGYDSREFGILKKYAMKHLVKIKDIN